MSQEILDIGRAFLDTPAGEGILKKLSGFKGTVDEFKKTKAELKDKYDILVQAYDIKGSVANQQTSQPEPGVQVQLFFGLYPIKKEEFTCESHASSIGSCKVPYSFVNLGSVCTPSQTSAG